MDIKQYLTRASFLNALITTKLEQLEELHTMKTVSEGFLASGCDENARRRAEKTVEKIARLEASLNQSIDNYVDTKAEIIELIDSIQNDQLQMLLEQHYLCCKTWEQIADEQFISIRNVHYLHKKALMLAQAELERRNSARTA